MCEERRSQELDAEGRSRAHFEWDISSLPGHISMITGTAVVVDGQYRND
jgi:hypothetical protein